MHVISVPVVMGCVVFCFPVVGAFAAGWPFTLMLEKWGWNMAYGMVELSQVIVVVASFYLLFLLLGAKRKLKLS